MALVAVIVISVPAVIPVMVFPATVPEVVVITAPTGVTVKATS